jgi:hypothetical protein
LTFGVRYAILRCSQKEKESDMFEVGMGFLRQYRDYTATGEITSISTDADDETLISVLYTDGAVKTYTENCVMSNLGKRMIVTEEVIW